MSKTSRTVSVSAALLIGLLAPRAYAVAARPADAFVDSIGVNTHLSYTDGAYAKVDDVIIPRLQELGVRHLRDQMKSGDARTEALQKRLAGLGMRFLLITPINMSSGDIAGWLKRLGPDAVFAVEGPNEYDLFGGPEWPAELRNHTQMLWSLVQNDAQLSSVFVAGPSLVDHRVMDYPKLGDLSAYMELGNIHWYYAGWSPSASGAPYKKLEVIIDRYRPVTGDKPLIISECGYHNVVGDPNHWGTPRDVAAKYMPEMFLFHFGYGLLRSYSYELIDQFDSLDNREHNFGLLESDGEPKPAFTALRNLISLLSDPGPEFQPEALDFRITGDTADVETLLLQKRNGDFYLALWSGKPVWQPLDRVALASPVQAIQVEITTPFASIQKVKPNHGSAWEDLSYSGGVIPLVADEEVQLLRIVPNVTGLVPVMNPLPEPGTASGPMPGPSLGSGGATQLPTTPMLQPPIPEPVAPSVEGQPTRAGNTPSGSAGCGCVVAAPCSGSGLPLLVAGLLLALRPRGRRRRLK